MSNFNKLDFPALEVYGRNYLKWTQDVKLHLTAMKMKTTIEADNIAGDAHRASAMIFMRKHTEEALQIEYLAEENPHTLWVALEKRFNHQKTIYLAEARHDWYNIRFQDFKYVNEYNSEIYPIRSLLKFYGQELTEADPLEKRFSTFPASCLVLQQQYRERHFTRFSELITTLLLAEKYNNLLMKNDQVRPTGTRAIPLPETNAITHRDPNCENRGRRRVPRSNRPRHGRRCPQRNGPYNRSQLGQDQRYLGHSGQVQRGGYRGPSTQRVQNEENAGLARYPQNLNNPCYCCGGTNHWSQTCRAPVQVVREYLVSRENREINFAEELTPTDTNLEITDFQAATG